LTIKRSPNFRWPTCWLWLWIFLQGSNNKLYHQN